MKAYLIKNAKIVNEGEVFQGDLLIENGRIAQIDETISHKNNNVQKIDVQGCYLLPGIIDDQVHFREPGLTHKGDLSSESRAAVAGGITSFIEQPNTVPQATTIEILEKKFDLAKEKSMANYSFTLGATNDNLEELKKASKTNIAGIKMFMGSSTGNMLVDDHEVLSKIFAEVDHQLIAHCEDEQTIRNNEAKFIEKYGDDIPIKYHPEIRSAEACYLSSSFAVDLAKKHDARLHVYHLSSAKETSLFSNKIPLGKKKITAEACVHHLFFCDKDYDEKKTFIKWNPAVKSAKDRDEIWKALLDGRLDVVATDHAPHTLEEKENVYTKAPSGGPLVQHSLVVMMEFVSQGKLSIERMVELMCHNPAILFGIKERGYIREGFKADLVVVDPSMPWTVNKENVLSKCGWSPFENSTFKSRVTHTFVNGVLAYNNGNLVDEVRGERLEFDRNW